MRKTIIVAAGLLAAGLMGSQAHADKISYTAALNGASEVPPTSSKGTGAAQIDVDTVSKAVAWAVTYAGLSGPATAAHIHCGAPAGSNAGVAVSFGAKLDSPIQGTGTMTDDQLAKLAAGQCYVNIHTGENKGGEIRGQLAPK